MGRRPYRRDVTSLNIALAKEDATTGVSLVPASWTGPASTACQTQLDTLRTLLVGLDPLLETAASAMTALDDAGYQCGVVG